MSNGRRVCKRLMQMQSIYTSVRDKLTDQSARMIFARRLTRLVVVCYLVAVTARLAHADEPGDFKLDERQGAAVEAFFDAYQKVRDDDYGNVHFVMTETHEEQAEKQRTRAVTEIRYWARDNRYFRVDSKVTESSDPKRKVGRRERMVLGPDGWISLFAESTRTPLAIHSWGSFEEGKERLGGYSFFQAAARGYSIHEAIRHFWKLIPAELQDKLIEDKQYLQGVARQTKIVDLHISEDRSRIELKSTWHSDPASSESTMLTDVKKGVVLHHESKLFNERILESSSTSDKEYDFGRFKSIPAHHREKRAADANGAYRSRARGHLCCGQAGP
jgi:hypothetical protein